jgi:hypothetical protein
MTRCERCGYATASYSTQERAWLCGNCYLGPLDRRLSGGTASANDTLSAPSRRPFETPSPRPAETPVAEPDVPTSTSTSRTTTTSRKTLRGEETQTLAETASVGGATETRETTKSRSGSELFDALERDALKHGAKPARIPNDLESLTPAQRKVAHDVAYVLGIYEWHDGPGVPQPYSQRWRAHVLGMSHMSVGRTLKQLVTLGVLADCGETEPHRHYPRGTKLYAVGALALQPQAPAVEVAVDEDPQMAAPDDGAVVEAEVGVVPVAGGLSASVGGADIHVANATDGSGAQCAIFDDF